MYEIKYTSFPALYNSLIVLTAFPMGIYPFLENKCTIGFV